MRPDKSDFVERYGGIYEHSPWVAEQVFDAGGAELSSSALIDAFATTVDDASDAQKLALICAHPDLAGRVAMAGKLSPDSSREQASAGLDACSPEELRTFKSLNDRYREKFGFPFVMAVKNSGRQEIITAMANRLEHDPATEFHRALAEIHQIAKLRFEGM